MSSLTHTLRRNWQLALSRQAFTFGSLLLVLLLAGLAGFASYLRAPHTPALTAASPETVAKVKARIQQLPLYFIENQGQSDKQVAYYVQGRDTSAYFTAEGLTLSLQEPLPPAKRDASRAERARHPARHQSAEAARRRWAVKVQFVGGAPVQPHGGAKTAATVNYFKGSQADWKTALPTYSDVVYSKVWPGIDVVYSGDSGHIKTTFQVQPGADPQQVQLAYQGATSVTLTEAGRLAVQTPVGGFEEDIPVVYQEIDGRRVPVEARYNLEKAQAGEWRYGFVFGAYDPERPLIIDPAMLLYAGYVGGSDDEDGNAIAVDGLGQAYVTGRTYSSQDSFPVRAGPDLTYNSPIHSNTTSDAFVVKVSADSTHLVYAGYIGGSEDDYGNGIAVDSLGQAYVVGSTNSSQVAGFPVRVGPDLTFNNSGSYAYDAFVAKVSADGTHLVYAGYIGGSEGDYGNGIAVDILGQAYVIGAAYSPQAQFPVRVGPDLTHNGNGDAFVAKVSADGAQLVYAGYIGGDEDDNGHGIAVDSSGQAYVAGLTHSMETSFPVRVGPDLTYNGPLPSYLASDAFVAKVSSDGAHLVYAGYIGGNGFDFGAGVAVDGLGQAYVVGTTQSTEASFPVLVGPDLSYNGSINSVDRNGRFGGDGFVVKVSADGSRLAYAGYIGGSSDDFGNGIAVDGLGQAYVAGHTESVEPSFPVRSGPDLTFNGGVLEGKGQGSDAFVAKVSANGEQLVYSGYIGGFQTEEGTGVAVDGMGQAYVVGSTTSDPAEYFPVLGGPSLTRNGSIDAFVAKISADPALPGFALTVTKVGDGNGTVVSGTPGIYCGTDCSESYISGTVVTLTGMPATGSSFTGWGGACSGTGVCQVTLNAAASVIANFALNAAVNQPPLADAGAGQTINAGVKVTLDGSGSNDPDHGPSPITYRWSQTGGPSVTLVNSTTATPSFTPLAAGTYLFQLIVYDGLTASVPDTVTIMVNDVAYFMIQTPNGGEVWNEGSKQIISWNSQNIDRKMLLLLYLSTDNGLNWKKIASAPNVGSKTWNIPKKRYISKQAMLKICLKKTVQICDQSDATFTVNQAPVAEAGVKQTVVIGTEVTLNGGLSRDPDNGPAAITYKWTQKLGPIVTLTGADKPAPSFVPSAKGTYVFGLEVSDGSANSKQDKVTVKVNPTRPNR